MFLGAALSTCTSKVSGVAERDSELFTSQKQLNSFLAMKDNEKLFKWIPQHWAAVTASGGTFVALRHQFAAQRQAAGRAGHQGAEKVREPPGIRTPCGVPDCAVFHPASKNGKFAISAESLNVWLCHPIREINPKPFRTWLRGCTTSQTGPTWGNSLLTC